MGKSGEIPYNFGGHFGILSLKKSSNSAFSPNAMVDARSHFAVLFFRLRTNAPWPQFTVNTDLFHPRDHHFSCQRWVVPFIFHFKTISGWWFGT